MALLARSVAWRQLIPGALALVAIAAAMVGVVTFAHVAAHPDGTARIYAATSSVRGLLEGTDVWLAGQRIGRVAAISFAPPAHDTARRVVLSLDVRRDVLPLLRRDSRAELRSGGSLVGAPVLFVEFSGSTAPALQPGDTLVAEPRHDPAAVAMQVTGVGRDLPGLAADLKALRAQIRSTRGSIGAVVAEGGTSPIASTADALSGAARRFGTDTGTLGRLLDPVPSRRARSLLARMDTIGRLLASDRASIGRFRRDSTLPRELERLRAELTAVQPKLGGAQRSLQGMASDSTLMLDVARIGEQVTRLLEDMKRNPLRYLIF